MINTRQPTKNKQVVDSIEEEIESYLDAILQVELKNHAYRPSKAPVLSSPATNRRI